MTEDIKHMIRKLYEWQIVIPRDMTECVRVGILPVMPKDERFPRYRPDIMDDLKAMHDQANLFVKTEDKKPMSLNHLRGLLFELREHQWLVVQRPYPIDRKAAFFDECHAAIKSLPKAIAS